MKVKLLESNYDKETGISTASIETDCGIFYGKARLHPDDKEYESNFAGCNYAETRAIIKYFKYKAKIVKIKIEGIKSYEKTLKNRKDYNKYSIENIMLKKYIVELEKNKAHWEDNIVSLQEKLNAGIDNRIKVIKKMKDKKGDK